MKKITALIFSIFLIAPLMFSQESEEIKAQADSDVIVTAEPEAPEDNSSLEEEQPEDDKNAKKKNPFFEQVEFIVQFEPTLFLSPDSKKNKSNVVNIVYPIAVGALWPNDFWVGFQPTISFFSMQMLWYDNMALPAEIENRTATTIASFINLPAVFTLKLPHSKLHLSAGLGIFARYGFRSIGVNENDPGYNGNSAQDDVKLINKWFWENGHWFYLTFGTSWLYPISEKFQIGPVINAYIPMGTLIDQHDVQGMMISIGVKLCI